MRHDNDIGSAFDIGLGLGLEEDIKPGLSTLELNGQPLSQPSDPTQTQLFSTCTSPTSLPLSDSLYAPIPTHLKGVPKRRRQCAKSAPASRHSTPTHSIPFDVPPGTGSRLKSISSSGSGSGGGIRNGGDTACWRPTPGKSVISAQFDRRARPGPRSHSSDFVGLARGFDDLAQPTSGSYSQELPANQRLLLHEPNRRRRALLRSRTTLSVPDSRIDCIYRPPAARPPTPAALIPRNQLPSCGSFFTENYCASASASQCRTDRSVNGGAAMPGQSTGGSAPITKRSASEDAGDGDATSSSSSSKTKLARVDRGSEDFSSVVKSRLSSYTRTGQACDRCKVRTYSTHHRFPRKGKEGGRQRWTKERG